MNRHPWTIVFATTIIILIIFLFLPNGGKHKTRKSPCCRNLVLPLPLIRAADSVTQRAKNLTLAPMAKTEVGAEKRIVPSVRVTHSAPKPQSGGGDLGPSLEDFAQLQAAKMAYIMQTLLARTARANAVSNIDRFLAGSPMAGLGECMMENSERTGVWVFLCPAQAKAESSNGECCCASFDPFGMYMAFGSWTQAISAYFDNIIRHWGPVQNAHQLVNPNYCEPPEPYNSNVQNLAVSISTGAF